CRLPEYNCLNARQALDFAEVWLAGLAFLATGCWQDREQQYAEQHEIVFHVQLLNAQGRPFLGLQRTLPRRVSKKRKAPARQTTLTASSLPGRRLRLGLAVHSFRHLAADEGPRATGREWSRSSSSELAAAACVPPRRWRRTCSSLRHAGDWRTRRAKPSWTRRCRSSTRCP